MRTNIKLRCECYSICHSLLLLVCSATSMLLLLGGFLCMWSTQSPAAFAVDTPPANQEASQAASQRPDSTSSNTCCFVAVHGCQHQLLGSDHYSRSGTTTPLRPHARRSNWRFEVSHLQPFTPSRDVNTSHGCGTVCAHVMLTVATCMTLTSWTAKLSCISMLGRIICALVANQGSWTTNQTAEQSLGT